MSATNFDDLFEHLGHDVVVVAYSKDGSLEDAHNVAIECITCYEILLDYDKEENETYIDVEWVELEVNDD